MQKWSQSDWRSGGRRGKRRRRRNEKQRWTLWTWRATLQGLKTERWKMLSPQMTLIHKVNANLRNVMSLMFYLARHICKLQAVEAVFATMKTCHLFRLTDGLISSLRLLFALCIYLCQQLQLRLLQRRALSLILTLSWPRTWPPLHPRASKRTRKLSLLALRALRARGALCWGGRKRQVLGEQVHLCVFELIDHFIPAAEPLIHPHPSACVVAHCC